MTLKEVQALRFEELGPLIAEEAEKRAKADVRKLFKDKDPAKLTAAESELASSHYFTCLDLHRDDLWRNTWKLAEDGKPFWA